MKRQAAIICLLMGLANLISGNPVFVRSTLQEINACEGKIELKLIMAWGDEEYDDENQFFRMPMDIKIGQDGLVYILDSGDDRIKVFDRSGKYVRTIGRRGQGPSDLLSPRVLAFDSDNNIIVADNYNRRIQTFDPGGNYLYSFRLKGVKRPSYISVNSKNEILVHSHENTFITGSLITLYNSRGKKLREIGNLYYKPKSLLETAGIFFAVDKEDNIFIAYYGVPFFWKYSNDGQALMVSAFDMTGKKVQKHKDGYRVIGHMKANASCGISLDRHGYVYLITSGREVKEEDKFFIVSTKKYPRKLDLENTDRFRLLVFNPEGKIIAAKKLNVFCGGIYVHENSLFIIDPYMALKIYEYRIDFRK
jgi:DNA-binding beta-propeller fold protein YncE